jgi:type I restriction enzyme S subunit
MGSGLRQNLDFSDFKRMPVVVPPREEQDGIVRFLDYVNRRIERYIRAKKKLIALLNEQKQGIIHRAVTLGLDPNIRRKYSESRWFPEIPEGSEVVTLRRVIHSAIDGPHFSPKYLDQGIPFLSARNVKSDRWSLEDAKFISESDYEEFSKRVRPAIDDVLYTKGGTTGIARAVDLTFPFQIWVHIAVLKLKRDLIDPEYLALVLNSPRCYEQSQLFTRGATNQDLGLGRMKNIELPLLSSIAWQGRLVEAVRNEIQSHNAGIGRTEREIALIREYRTRLIADVVTGKLDVREAAAKLPDEPKEADIELVEEATGVEEPNEFEDMADSGTIA